MMIEQVLANASEHQLASAVHENLYALFYSWQAIPGCEVVENQGLSLHYLPLSNPIFRGAWRTRLSLRQVEAKIDEVTDWFQQRGAPDFYWWTDVNTQPVDLAAYLMKRGFDGNFEGDPGMVADLHALNENVHPPDGFKIIIAMEKKTLHDWRDVFAAAYQTEICMGQAWVDATLAISPQNVPWQMYVGYLNNRPVATSILFNGAGVAGIYGVGTIPEVRHQGIGSAMTLQPLLDARRQGYNYGVLFSSRAGYLIYKRLGFQELDCRIGIYVLEISHKETL